jgi:hypothetical protein
MVVGCLLAPSALAAAGQPLIKASREAGRVTVALQSGDLRVTESVTRQGLKLRLETDGDALVFSGDLDGRVVIERAGQQRSFMVSRATAIDQAAAVEMLAHSPALAAFDALLASPWASTPPAMLFKSTRAVIRGFQGESMLPIHTLASAPPQSSFRPVRQRLTPSQCYDTYAKDVVHFTYELQACIGMLPAQWWNPLATWFCAYEYNLKSSLAAIWLLDCYGVGV